MRVRGTQGGGPGWPLRRPSRPSPSGLQPGRAAVSRLRQRCFVGIQVPLRNLILCRLIKRLL